MTTIYLDNAATTPIDSAVIETMMKVMSETFGNPSSTHQFGRKAKTLVEEARKDIAKHFNVTAGEIVFTAGGSEADNLILKNAVQNLGVRHIISSKIEHHAVLHTIEAIAEEFDVKVSYVNLHENGDVDYNALFHSDTVQAIGHYPIDLQKTPIDFMVASAHKFHGPKGVGFAIIKKGFGIKPLVVGGEQERGARAGTENVHNIVGMQKALTIAMDTVVKDVASINRLKQYFIDKLVNLSPDIQFNGCSGESSTSSCLILNVRFAKEIPMFLFHLDLKGIAASGGSACQSGSNKGSHVLNTILPKEEAMKTSVRFSFSKWTTKEELDDTLGVIRDLV